jgi:CubicO group peptidase (beta-lactamase class C family)
MTVEGVCEARFDAVRAAFEANLASGGEVGAAVCVTVGGETVVDLWGGVADPLTGATWERDTLGPVWSCTKGATALCAHMLVSRGQLDLDARVVDYWPEFGKNGKGEITVRMLLSHQAGLAAIREPVPEGGLCDWDLIVGLLEEQEPLWEPGTRHGYHGLTFGHLVGELVRRITGVSLGTFFRQEVAAPFGLDFWIGLPEELDGRVAPNIPADPPASPADLPRMMQVAMGDPSSIPGLQLINNGGFMLPGVIDSRAVRAAEIPAVNGVANARALAGMYRPLALGGSADGITLVSPAVLAEMSRVAVASNCDAAILYPTCFSLGFMKSIDNLAIGGVENSVLLSDAALGHAGFGGSLGFADPAARMSFGYNMNKQGGGLGNNARGQALVDAVYGALGYQQPAGGGIWFA